MNKGINENYNKHIVISNTFDRYRIFLYRLDDFEYFSNDYFRIIYVINGQVRLSIDEKVIRLEQNNLYYIGSNISYKISNTTGKNTLLILDIRKDYAEEFIEKPIDSSIYKNRDYIAKQEIVTLMGELYLMSFSKDWNTFTTNKKVESLMFHIREGVEDRYKIFEPDLLGDGSVENTIYKITQSLNQSINLKSEEISLSKISKEYNINYHYLSRQFKEIVGLNYTDYTLNIKLSKAVNLLINTDYKIVDISKHSAFSNIKVFNANFRNKFNTTPTELRRYYDDFKNTILKDSLHQEDEIKLFFKEVLNEDIMYFKPMIRNEIKINTKNRAISRVKDWDTMVDLNNIVDIEEDLYLIDNIFNKDFLSEVLLNIYIESQEIYILTKNYKKIKISIYNFKYIIDQIYKSNTRLFLVFNILDPINKDRKADEALISNIIEVIKGILGDTGIDKCRFGLNIDNIRSMVAEGRYLLLKEIIKSYKDILDKSVDKNYRGVLYLKDIEDEVDAENYLKLIDQLDRSSWNQYLIDINYRQIDNDQKEAFNYYIDIIDKFRLAVGDGDNLLIGFNYDISNIDLDMDILFNYATLYCVSIYFKLKEKGYKVAYINYIEELDGKKIRLDKYTHNRLGLKTPEYYITSIIKSFGRDIMINDRGVMVTREARDINIFLYDNIYELYKYLTSNLVVNISKSIEHDLELLGLKGKYKIIEYTFSLLDGRNKISDEHIINISVEEKELLDYSSMPNVDIDIKEIKEEDKYKFTRNLLDIKYIKLKKI